MPLFIAHGTNDTHVRPSSIEGFIEKLQNSDKDYTLHIMEDLGHGSGNKEEQKQLYEAMLTFLDRVT